ncbi:mucin and cadherin like, isoform CRA_a [Rattus norvegicus]|uniref:Cadherin-related family member 5 n=2 Tax=Rattus norvegicus TaxID=10116 RepID=CDHR5_RAT|nr:cadherin-related family member 5 precursor [Rattus norvegicus]Q9JIK1.1 RecName: Full=Cadherin-related family member 5; AltName: Full=GP100; AltName: Full=Mu-protocadherin; Flags: Precursor [Rattus norvegicus]AAF70456.1 mu-protocadherin [Rattus norvegicus]AAH98904.1 Mucin and cadherin like [Rattus norvegicus]EDM12012.1 mucin and cadherin like, isoform CRA_a [Rattus norvegicus]|eukprot:NP_612534.1 cadherin-related family member 5 precursor [Rattus norvegicus]
MGAPALLWPPLLLPLLTVLFGHLPGTLAQAQVCSANQTVFTMNENTTVSGPLADIFVPEDQYVTLGQLSTPNAFKVEGNKLFLIVTPDYEENSLLEAVLECKRGDTLVTQFRVFVAVLDINDNAPEFPFTIKEYNVSEDTRVNTIVIPETELKATDADKDDILVYTLQEVTPNASKFFSLVGINSPALKLDQTLDYYKSPNMTFRLLARDTREENVIPSHTATATVVLNVLPADLRTPWFLPCSFTDDYFCIQAQYHTVIPTGHKLPSPLILSPGPIYAVDGDQAINQPIVYSIMMGNTDDTFIINKDDGNLTMAKSIPSPMTFTLVVRAEQADMARYSVTQAVVEARDVTGNPLQFSQSLYFGTVVLGSEAGTAVKDKTFPSEILRIQAQYLGFPDLNSAVTYQVTNSSEFIMNKDILLTTVPMETERTIRIEVEANNTVTKDIATTIVEIQVSEREPPSTESPTPPEAGGTTGPSSNTTLETPSTSGTSQGPATTSSGGSAGPFPPAGTTLSPLTSAPTVPGGSPTLGISTSPQTATPGGDATQTPKPGTSQPMVPTPGASTSSQPATPSGSSTQTPKPGTSQPMVPTPGASTSSQPATPSGSSTQTPRPGTSQPMVPTPGASTSSQPATPSGSTQTPKPGTSQPTTTGPISGVGELGDGQRFSTVDMAVLGGVLGALLLLALIFLIILIHKHYRHRFTCCSGKAKEPQPSGYDNLTFLPDNKAKWSPTSNRKPEPGPEPVQPPLRPPSPMSSSPTPPSSMPPSPQPKASGSPKTVQAGDSPSAVRSILTKERRPEGEGGYKAVWFGKDIGAEADVVVLNEPTADVDSASASGSEGSDDDDDPDQKKSLRLGAVADNTYV